MFHYKSRILQNPKIICTCFVAKVIQQEEEITIMWLSIIWCAASLYIAQASSVAVHHHRDQVTVVDVEADATVSDLLRSLAVQIEDSSTEQHAVVFQGETLSRDTTLADAGIGAEAAVQLIDMLTLKFIVRYHHAQTDQNENFGHRATDIQVLIGEDIVPIIAELMNNTMVWTLYDSESGARFEDDTTTWSSTFRIDERWTEIRVVPVANHVVHDYHVGAYREYNPSLWVSRSAEHRIFNPADGPTLYKPREQRHAYLSVTERPRVKRETCTVKAPRGYAFLLVPH